MFIHSSIRTWLFFILFYELALLRLLSSYYGIITFIWVELTKYIDIILFYLAFIYFKYKYSMFWQN